MPRYEFTLAQQHSQAVMAVRRSQSILWRSTNQCIADIIWNGISNHYSRMQIAAQLRQAAGPHKKSEPSCLSSYRGAADSIDAGNDLSWLT